MSWWERGGEPVLVLAELWADWLYGHPMADGDVVYLPGQTGYRRVRSWRLRVGGMDRVVTVGTLADGRWWVAVSWEFHGDCGHVRDTEEGADAHARVLMEQWPVNPGEWVYDELGAAPATVRT